MAAQLEKAKAQAAGGELADKEITENSEQWLAVVMAEAEIMAEAERINTEIMLENQRLLAEKEEIMAEVEKFRAQAKGGPFAERIEAEVERLLAEQGAGKVKEK